MRRQTALTGLLIAAGVLVARVLAEVLLTVFFALTVAYVARPLYRWLRNRGVQRHVASGATTAAVFVVALLLSAPLFVVLYLRRGSIVEGVRDLPEQLTLESAGYSYTVRAGDVWDLAATQLQRIGRDFAASTPELLLQFFLFTVVVFGVLLGWTRTAAAVRTVVPRYYHDVLGALDRRVGDTLRAIYLVQIATAVVTFAVAVPTFWLLGYEFYLTLAVLCGVLQFMPVVGPSVVILGLAGLDLAAGDVGAAVLVVVVGGLVIAGLPDMIVRPQLAKSLADIPATLYFVGFFGGVLTIGIVGAILGPLALAVLVETVSLLGAERRAGREGQQATIGETDGRC